MLLFRNLATALCPHKNPESSSFARADFLTPVVIRYTHNRRVVQGSTLTKVTRACRTASANAQFVSLADDDDDGDGDDDGNDDGDDDGDDDNLDDNLDDDGDDDGGDDDDLDDTLDDDDDGDDDADVDESSACR